MSAPKLLDELPNKGGAVASRYDDFWRMLAANPGKWAEWPGSDKSSIASLAGAHTKNGLRFEGVRRAGRSYVRCVPS